MERWSEEEFGKKLKQLEEINTKEEKLGKFKAVVDELDLRTPE